MMKMKISFWNIAGNGINGHGILVLLLTKINHIFSYLLMYNFDGLIVEFVFDIGNMKSQVSTSKWKF